ncbi:MAG: MSCRAMM family protein [Gemmataceae bacterium]
MFWNQYEAIAIEGKPVEPKSVPLEAGKTVRVPVLVSSEYPFEDQYVFVRDAEGRVGGAKIYLSRWTTEARPTTVKLFEFQKLAGQMLQADGQPASGAIIQPFQYSSPPVGEWKQPEVLFRLPSAEQARVAVGTDAQGRFELPSIPGFRTNFEVVHPSTGKTRWTVAPDQPFVCKLPKTGSLTVTTVGAEPKIVAGRAFTLSRKKPVTVHEEALPVRRSEAIYGRFDERGQVTLEKIPVAEYEFRFSSTKRMSHRLPGAGTFPITITAGTAHKVELPLGPAAKVTGRVFLNEAKHGVEHFVVGVGCKEPNAPQKSNYYVVETDAEGRYWVYGPAGNYTSEVREAPAGVIYPGLHQSSDGPGPAVAAGETIELPHIQTQSSYEFVARVEHKGTPQSQVNVRAFSEKRWKTTVFTTDQTGLFRIPNLAPTEFVSPRIRKGKAVNFPRNYEAKTGVEPVRIELREEHAFSFQGRIVNYSGAPLSGVPVKLMHKIPYVNSHGQENYHTNDSESTTTDAEGRYRFEGLWPSDEYYASVKDDGYTLGTSPTVRGRSSITETVGDIRVAKKKAKITGIVTDTAGRPVADAMVVYRSAEKHGETQCNADGTFEFRMMSEVPMVLVARQAGYQAEFVAANIRANDRITIVLRKSGEPNAAVHHPTPEHEKALQAIRRKLLVQMWNVRDEVGAAEQTIERMATLDLETAKKWRDEEWTRSKGKTDYNRNLRYGYPPEKLLDLAKKDLDDLIAVMNEDQSWRGRHEFHRLAEILIPVDKSKALRVTEEMAVQVRVSPQSFPNLQLAMAGMLAIQAGGKGERLLAEAGARALKPGLPPDAMNKLDHGMTAARVARVDGPLAEKLLNQFRDPNDYNRFLAATVLHVAPVDAPRAKSLLGKFKPERGNFYQCVATVHYALAIADKDPESALAAVRGLQKETQCAVGLVRLAHHWSKTDRPRATRCIDEAFDFIETNNSLFRERLFHDDGCGHALFGLVRASEMKHPQLRSLMARTLALLPKQKGPWTSYAETPLMPMVSAFALVEPRTALHLLNFMKPAEQIVKDGDIEHSDRLFALTFADPNRTEPFIDQFFETQFKIRPTNAKADARQRLHILGVRQLEKILSNADRYGELSSALSYPLIGRPEFE